MKLLATATYLIIAQSACNLRRIGAEAIKTLLSIERGRLAPLEAKSKLLQIRRRVPNPQRVKRCLEVVQQDPQKAGDTGWAFAKEICSWTPYASCLRWLRSRFGPLGRELGHGVTTMAFEPTGMGFTGRHLPSQHDLEGPLAELKWWDLPVVSGVVFGQVVKHVTVPVQFFLQSDTRVVRLFVINLCLSNR